MSACDAPTSVLSTSTSRNQAIINGDTCGTDDEPTAVAIMLDADFESQVLGNNTLRQASCTGTLIAPDVVLTAAHCVDRELLDGQLFGVGTFTRVQFAVTREADLSRYATSMEVLPLPDDAVFATGFIQNAGFDINTFSEVNGPGNFNDTALLFLSAPLDLTPEKILTSAEASEFVEGTTLTIAGWGQNVAEGGGPFTPPAPGTVGIKKCGTSTLTELGEFEFQVGDGVDSTRKCHGDSGGPSYMVLQNGERRVVGITSHAYDMTDCSKVGIDTRVDVWADWIAEQSAEACGMGLRPTCAAEGEGEVDVGEGEGEVGIGEGEGEVDLGEGDAGEGEGDDEDTLGGGGCGCTQASDGAPLVVAGLVLLGRRRLRLTTP
jgi:hypothetical protein